MKFNFQVEVPRAHHFKLVGSGHSGWHSESGWQVSSHNLKKWLKLLLLSVVLVVLCSWTGLRLGCTSWGSLSGCSASASLS